MIVNPVPDPLDDYPDPYTIKTVPVEFEKGRNNPRFNFREKKVKKFTTFSLRFGKSLDF
ncbi:MAG TPA: hypothetical protein VLX29_00900 [Nitrospirota bacterium]|nr:hypothetical protein [Nitrospirota bacterium]